MHILIIGNGVAGITAARYIRKRSNHDITVVSAESEYYFSRTALMYVYMGHMRFEDIKPYEDWFWEKNRIHLVQAYAHRIDTGAKMVRLSTGNNIPYDKLILATGSQSNKFGWPGEDLRGVQGLYSLQDLETMEQYTRGIDRGVVVGGGLIGIELAEMLNSRGIRATMLVRERSYWDNVLPHEESKMVSRHIRDHGIDLRLSTELKQVLGDANGRVRAVETSDDTTIECQFVGLTPGVHPNLELARASNIQTGKGILVDEYLQTDHPDIFAIGDCAELKAPPPGRKAIEPVWYTGKLMGKTVARTICKKPTPYRPGIWYNSAKFFDIEYQVYGYVPGRGQETENDRSLYWEHDDGRKSIRLVYNAASRELQGINLMGVRFRHDVADKMISEKWKLESVLTHLKALDFDPEFQPAYARKLVASYNREFPQQRIELKPKRSLKQLIFG
jgi:NAD(P)H-nitrite reductase large subunit